MTMRVGVVGCGRKTGRGFYDYQARGAGGASAPGAATNVGGTRP